MSAPSGAQGERKPGTRSYVGRSFPGRTGSLRRSRPGSTVPRGRELHYVRPDYCAATAQRKDCDEAARSARYRLVGHCQHQLPDGPRHRGSSTHHGLLSCLMGCVATCRFCVAARLYYREHHRRSLTTIFPLGFRTWYPATLCLENPLGSIHEGGESVTPLHVMARDFQQPRLVSYSLSGEV